jgi:hypothetical protein
MNLHIVLKWETITFMRYKSCPACGASNRGKDQECYSCNARFGEAENSPKPVGDTPTKTVNFTSGTEASALAGFVAIALSTILGTGLGYGISLLETELPFFLAEVLLGVICATGAAFALAKFQDMPEGLMAKRLGPAAGFGALVGLCLFAIWWTFDPQAGFPVIGGIAGLCSGVPIAVSFGLLGGESRPLGTLEYMNVLMSLGGGALFAIFIAFEDADFYIVPGIAGIIGLLPTLFGGRINMVEVAAQLSDD